MVSWCPQKVFEPSSYPGNQSDRLIDLPPLVAHYRGRAGRCTAHIDILAAGGWCWPGVGFLARAQYAVCEGSHSSLQLRNCSIHNIALLRYRVPLKRTLQRNIRSRFRIVRCWCRRGKCGLISWQTLPPYFLCHVPDRPAVRTEETPPARLQNWRTPPVAEPPRQSPHGLPIDARAAVPSPKPEPRSATRRGRL